MMTLLYSPLSFSQKKLGSILSTRIFFSLLKNQRNLVKLASIFGSKLQPSFAFLLSSGLEVHDCLSFLIRWVKIFMMKRLNMMRKKSKLCGMGNEDGEDRISSLPDAIICHILSFLPTKYAVATSVLSSRWRLIWTSVPNICLDDRLCPKYKGIPASTRFENFVNRVIVLCDDSVNINKFSINCHKFGGLPALKFWVSYAIARRVHEIELTVKGKYNVELPDSICTSKTLEVLRLNSDFVFKIPSSGMCFPCLKILHLEMMYLKSNIVEKLFTICPLLEDLSIKGIIKGYGSVTKFNISSPTLKRLTLRLEEYDAVEDKHQVVVQAPNLEHLDITDNTPLSYVVHELHSLTKVSFHIVDEFVEDLDPPDANCVIQFLKGIANTKFLSFRAGTMSALGCAMKDFFPPFPNLTHLEVMIADLGCHLLPIILSSASKLEAFVLDQKLDANFAWNEPPCVPICLLSNLKKIEIKGFNGMESQLELLRYFLKNGQVLNTMVIELPEKWAGRKNSIEKLRQILLMFEKGSQTCQVVIP